MQQGKNIVEKHLQIHLQIYEYKYIYIHIYVHNACEKSSTFFWRYWQKKPTTSTYCNKPFGTENMHGIANFRTLFTALSARFSICFLNLYFKFNCLFNILTRYVVIWEEAVEDCASEPTKWLQRTNSVCEFPQGYK